jgi:transposase
MYPPEAFRQTLVPPRVFARLLEHVEAIEGTPRRKRKLSNAEALYQMLRVMKRGVCWRDTEGMSTVYSWQAVYKRFRQWTEHETFKKAWEAVIQQYASHLKHQDPQWFQNLFIDGTMIKNYEVTQCYGKNPTDRGRSGTKLSIICDRRRQIVGVVEAPANVSDSRLVIPTIASIPFDIQDDHRRSIHIIGDKGYSSNTLARRVKSYDRRFTLIADRKKNARRPVNRRSQSQQGKKMQSERPVVEHSIANLKNMKRLRARDDKLRRTFMSFVHLGIMVRGLEAFDKYK